MERAQRFPLAEANQAHELLGKEGVTGKIVLMLGLAMFFERSLMAVLSLSRRESSGRLTDRSYAERRHSLPVPVSL